MNLTENDLLLVTGGTGLVGSHVVERACQQGLRTRVLARPSADTSLLKSWGADVVPGDMGSPESLPGAVAGATVIVHCAAKVGDWGPVGDYRVINVEGLENLIEAAETTGKLRRFIHISSLGVYEARDHYGTDESEQPSADGIDGYTLTKYEAEQVVWKHIREHRLPATLLRPGFIYGPRDRTVLPRLLERIRSQVFAYLGPNDKLMNNTFVGNLVDAVFLALEHDDSIGQVYNVTDGQLVSKKEFISTVARLAGYPEPKKTVPLGVARALARILETLWRILGKQEAPILSRARIKFLGLNLDFCIDKARRELNYSPRVSFEEGMRQTIGWFRSQGLV